MTTTPHRVPRWLVTVLTPLIGLLAVLSFAMSFVALRDLAARSGIPENIAWAWPVIVDGLIVVAMLYIFTQEEGRAFAWFALVTFAAISIVSNGMHTSITLDPSKGVTSAFAIFIGTVPPISLLVISELLARILTASRTTGAIAADTGSGDDVAVFDPTTVVEPLAAEVPTAVMLPDTRPAIDEGKSDTAEVDSPSVVEHSDNADTPVTPPVTVLSASDDTALASVTPIHEMTSVIQVVDDSPAIPDDPDGQVAWLVERTKNDGDMALETLVDCFDAAGLSLSKRTIQRRLADARAQRPDAFAS